MQTFNMPADCETSARHPEEIIGPDMMSFITRHYRAASSIPDGEDFNKSMEKKFSHEDRKIAGETYHMLRDAGFYPSYIDRFGVLVWGIRLKSPLRYLSEKESDYYVRIGSDIMTDRGVTIPFLSMERALND